jgi:hypothetical protein
MMPWMVSGTLTSAAPVPFRRQGAHLAAPEMGVVFRNHFLCAGLSPPPTPARRGRWHDCYSSSPASRAARYEQPQRTFAKIERVGVILNPVRAPSGSFRGGPTWLRRRLRPTRTI